MARPHWALLTVIALTPFSTQAAVIISDQTFNPSDWTSSIVGGTGGASQASTQQGSGGNPGSYRQMTHDMPGASNIVVWHIYNAGGYDPSAEGAIVSIDYSEDRIELSPPFAGAAIGGAFILQQGGGTWVANTNLVFTNLSWATVSLTGLVASDFNASIGATGLPDFSSTGAPITFGIQRSNTNSNPMGGGSYMTTSGLDNWSVTVNQVPVPTTALLLGTGLIGLIRWMRRRAAA